ncbi:MAG: hypothetical protein PHR16_17370 [Methylovulum sp.]|nr:hypothetical protein [Methylovulum sp.]
MNGYLRYEAWLLTNKTDKKDWEPKKQDKRKLNDLINLWFEKHEQFLKSGKNRKAMLSNLAGKTGNPYGQALNTSDFSVYRNERLKAGTSKNMMNHEQAYLRAMFSELIRLDE